MLSKQEQEKRARYVSSLYGKPLERKAQPRNTYTTHKWSVTLFVTALYLLPFLVANALFSFYNNSLYSSEGDVRTWSLLFIVYFIGLAVLFIVFMAIFKNELYRHYTSSRLIFVLTIFFTIPLLYFLHEIIAGQHAQEPIEIVVRVIIYSIVAYGATAGIIAGLTIFIDKIARRGK